MERNMNETRNLTETKRSLERAIEETEGPLKVTSECLYKREGRKVKHDQW